MRRHIWVWFRMFLVCTTISVAMPGFTQDKFPSRPIEIIVPITAGGGTDTAFRMLAEVVEPILGQKVVIVNKPGGGGLVGTSTIVRANPDGYTLGGLWNAPLTIVPHTLAAPYTPNDYVAIILVVSAPNMLCTKPEFPASTGQELIEQVKKNPGKYTYGTDGVGGVTHLGVERVFAKLGVRARPVPFGSAADSLKNFLGGHVDMYGGGIPAILPYVKNGTAKCLLIMSVDRAPLVPQAASLTDLGVPETQTLFWVGLIGPKNIPPDRIAILENAFRQAVLSERFRQLSVDRGLVVDARVGGDFRKFIDSEYQAMGEIVRTLGLAPR